jgi:hypothetical protein
MKERYRRESVKERGDRLVFVSSARLEDEQQAHGTQEAAPRGGRESLEMFHESVEHSTTNEQGGLLLDRPQSEWDPETLVERPWDMDDTRRLFVEAEARFRAGSSSLGPRVT